MPQVLSVPRVCPKCNQITETPETKCPRCGKRLQKVATIRTLGALSTVLGIVLLAGMSWLSWWIYHTISASGNPNATSHFNGGSREIAFIAFVFGLIIIFSLTATIAGIWQLIFGKRNKLLTLIVIILGFVFVGTGLAVTLSK